MKKRLRKKLHQGEFAPPRPQTAYQRIAQELGRQRVGEGYSEAHDDAHLDGALELAADAYAQEPGQRGHLLDAPELPAAWPWAAQYWKPTPADRERELVKAGALYEAERGRLLRAYTALQQRAAGPAQPQTLRGQAASHLAQARVRVGQKQAQVQTQLLELILRRLLPTRATGPWPGAQRQLATSRPELRAALRVFRGGRRGPWLYTWTKRPGGGTRLSLSVKEQPGYRFVAHWTFDAAGLLTSFFCRQARPVASPTPLDYQPGGPEPVRRRNDHNQPQPTP